MSNLQQLGYPAPPPAPPPSASAYRSSFGPLAHPGAAGRPGHQHQHSGGSDRSYQPLTPVGSVFPRSVMHPQPHPNASVASSQYNHPHLDGQPPSPHPFHPVPHYGFFHPAQSGGDAYPTYPPQPVGGGGQPSLEPSPFISSPHDPAVGPFSTNGAAHDVGPIGAGYAGGPAWTAEGGGLESRQSHGQQQQ